MRIFATAVAVSNCVAVQAQVPHILGTWELNAEESTLPGPPPQTEVRSYELTSDGVLVGTAVIVDAAGSPRFLQFAARPDGMDYPEFDASTAAQYLIDGTAPRRTYAEKIIDSHTVEWTDKADGRVIASGRKWVSADGRTLSFTVDALDERGEDIRYLFVYDRTSP